MSEDAYQRITCGDIDAYVGVILKQARKLVRGKLPHPEGRPWNLEDDPHELASEYFLSPSYRNVLLSATNEDDLNALVFTALRNQIRAKLRDNDRARLRRRMKEIMAAEGFVERPAKFWRRPADAAEQFGGPLAELVEASWRATVQLVRWRSDAKRNSPVAERASFVGVLDEIFRTAGGAIHEDDLVDVLARRFGVGPVTHMESMDVPDEAQVPEGSPGPEEQVVADDETIQAERDALWVWGQLSPLERLLIPHLHLSAREAAPAVGRGRTAVNEAQRRLKVKMHDLLDHLDADRQSAVVARLSELVQSADS